MAAGVPLDVPMIPALLAAEGYERHAIGKWHAGYAVSLNLLCRFEHVLTLFRYRKDMGARANEAWVSILRWLLASPDGLLHS